MSGFFKLHEITGSDLDKAYGCGSCELYRTCIHPRMKPHGEGRKGIMILAEAPGEKEDQRGVPLVGDCGLLVRRLLKRNGVDLDLDCVKINAVACRPPENRTPTLKEINACRPRVWDTIQSTNPKVLFLFGGSAVNTFLGHRLKKDVGAITRWIGRAIPDQETGIWVVPTYHPSFILRNPQNPVVEMMFEEHLQLGIKLSQSDNFPDFGNEESKIKVLTKKSDIVDYLIDILDRKPEALSIDYETSGLKPHAPGHFIECASIAESGDEGYAFPFYPDIKKYWVKILRDKQIGKMAHNMKFEDTWSYHILGTRVFNWVWDSMIAAHVLDNRPHVCGLKFQAYVNFGIVDYDSYISKYLSAGGRKSSANDFNRVRKANRMKLLTYCGMDSMLEHRLATIQMNTLERGWE